MKRYSYLFSLVIIFIITMASCNDSKTYAELLKEEKVTIANYLKRNKIKVVSDFPTGNSWPDSIYVKTSSGLYFHLINGGDDSAGADTLKTNDLVAVRYLQYTLTEKTDTLFSWNTIDSPYPTTFNFQNYSQACKAWHEALSYMKKNEAEAQIIVTSKLGFETYMKDVTPMGYKLKIQFQK